jgi:hypothetical protein
MAFSKAYADTKRSAALIPVYKRCPPGDNDAYYWQPRSPLGVMFANVDRGEIRRGGPYREQERGMTLGFERLYAPPVIGINLR